MIRRSAACVLWLVAAAAARGEDSFVLSSGPDEVLHGTFESFSPEGVVIRRRDAAEPLVFRPGAVAVVEFGRSAAAAPMAGTALVRFNNGDALPGRVVSFTAEKTVLETSAGRLEMDSSFVRSFEFSGGLGADLIGKQTDWRQEGAANRGRRNRNVFQIQQGKVILKGYGWHTRTADIPASGVLVLELGASDNVFCAFGQERAQLGEGGGYMLRIQGAQITLMSQARGAQKLIVNAALPPTKGGAAHRRVALAMDGAAKTAVLMVNGQVVGRSGKDAFIAPKGKYLMLGCSNGGQAIVSRLALVPGVEREVGKAPADDLLTLANRDRVKGKLVSIANGTAVFEGETGRLAIPLTRVAGVAFSAAHQKMPAGEGARVFFGGLEGLTLRLDKVAQGRIKAQSAIFGPCDIGLDQVTRIEWVPQTVAPPQGQAGLGEGEADDEDEWFEAAPAVPDIELFQ